MSEFPWYRWWVQDFAGDPRVRRMTPHARGAYRDLLDLSWGLGPLMDPVLELVSVGWPRCEAVLLWDEIAPAWSYDPEAGWTQPRLEDERERARDRSAAARSSARARWKRKSQADRWKALGEAEAGS